MSIFLGGMGNDDYFNLTKISKLKKGEFFRKKGGKKVYIYNGKDRAYSRYGDFKGWGFSFTDFEDSSNFFTIAKDIPVEAGFTF
jgi:hypothetical protein